MPPQARFEGVVTEEQQHQPITMMSALSERSNPSIRKIHPRFLLAENPLKAPMNPEEVYLMRRGETLMKQSRQDAKKYSFQKLNSPRQFQVASEPSRTKKFANSFLQRFRKSKYHTPRISPAKQ